MTKKMLARKGSKRFRMQLDMTLPAKREAVDPAVQQIMAEVRKTNRVAGKEDDIELALAEALANAVVHGAKSDPSKIIECDVACDEKRGMLIVVRDPGPGFDPALLPVPTTGENLYSDHGRGVYLMNQLMDEVRYHKNGTEIHMVKR